MVIFVGNVYLQQNHDATLDLVRIAAIEAVTNVPLVIHGGSGVPPKIRGQLARDTAICKFNIGTQLRMAFGRALRDCLAADGEKFDRVEILKATEAPVSLAAREVIASLGAPKLTN